MNRIFKGFYSLLIAGVLSLAVMAGCGGGGGGGSTSDDNSGGGTSSSLAGTYKLDEGCSGECYEIYTFTDTTWSFTATWLNGSCSANGTYSLSGNTLTETYLQDGCDQSQVNSTYTRIYSISGNTLTLTDTEYNETNTWIKVGSYAISGRVADSSNIGISGVKVDISGARYATTDSTGNYSITELANGSYTLTPSKTGYTFNPAYKAVTVSGANITGQDFVGSGTPGTEAYEPNDSFAAASTSLISGNSVTAKISSSTDVDYYSINVASVGTISISMVPPTNSDYDLELYNSAYSSVASSTNGTGITETVSFSVSPGAYYIKVYGYQNAFDADNTYSLTATWSTSGSGGGGGTSSSWASVSVGGDNYSRHTVAIKTDGTLWAWGSNFNGQLGDGTIINRTTPTQIGSDTNWKSVSAGGYSHTVAIKTDGTLWAWGYNWYGQLGDGTTSGTTFPIQIGTATDWASVSAGGTHSVAIKTDGTLWAWGGNYWGQLGDGTTTNRTSPTKIGTSTNWASVFATKDKGPYYQYTFAIKTDGTLWSWGGSGRLTPTQIGVESNWASVSAVGGYDSYTLAIKTNGTLWAWGDNTWGQLGDGSIADRANPTQIGTSNNWASVSAAGSDYGSYTVAIKTDGTLWAWGDNTYGQLGDGTRTDRITPIQIGSDSNWKSISAKGGQYYSYTAAIKTDGTMWVPNVVACYGFDCGFNYGQL